MGKHKTNAVMEAASTDDQLRAVRDAFRQQFQPAHNGLGIETGPYCYVEDVYLNDGYLICEMGDAYYRVDFTKKDGKYSFTAKADWKRMEQTYVPASEAVTRTRAIRGELADLRESQLDGEGFVVKGVTLIKPGFSTNTDKAGRPRYYPKATLEAAAQRFEGVRAYINHPSRSQAQDLPERSVADIAGYYENVKAAADGALKGDLRIVGAAQATIWPLIKETVERKPGLVDLSISALGTTKVAEAEGKKAVVVESIVAANSVDIVTTGAAGGGFTGALLTASDDRTFTRQLLEALSFEEWREARPEFVDKLKGEWKTVRNDQALTEARAQIETLKKNAAALEEQHRAEVAELAEFRRGALADRLLAESNLPHTVRAQVRADVVQAGDEAGMKQVIEREKARYNRAPREPVPVNGAGQRTAAPAATSEPASANPVAEAMGINPRYAPRDGESPEQWQARVRALNEAK